MITSCRRLAAVGLVLATAAFASLSSVAAGESATKCSNKGLRFAVNKEGVTYSVGVRKLRARGATCKRARSIARTVAKRILGNAEIPDVLAGYSVKAEAPCSGCSPVTEVNALKGDKRITFKVAGGV